VRRPETPVPAQRDDDLPAGRGVVSSREHWAVSAVSTLARGTLALLLGLLLWAQLPVLVGGETTVVMSGSMSPALAAGDLAVVRPVEETDLQVGQVLLVDDPDRPGSARLHRLAAVESGGLRLKGDANATPDTSLVAPAAVHGVARVRIPFVGLPVLWSTGRHWLPLAATGMALLGLFAAAGWHRPPGGAPDTAVRVAVRTPSPRVGGRGRHAAPRARRGVPVRHAAAFGVVLAVCPLLLEHATPAAATYSADTTEAGNSATMTMDSVLAWGCVHETATVTATRFYSLREKTGTAMYNTGTLAVPRAQAKGNASLHGGVTQGTTGPDCGRGPTGAVTLDGATGWISTSLQTPSSDDVTTQVWFRTRVAGGVLFGLNGSEVGSAQHDRHVYMTNTGELVFGVYRNGFHTVASQAGTSYADGKWHLATATLGSTGMRLYVDGTQVAADPTQTAGEPLSGSYWRFGWTSLGNWAKRPTNNYFTGDLASAAVFGRALTATEVKAQYLLVR
jgi:signal peptidase I